MQQQPGLSWWSSYRLTEHSSLWPSLVIHLCSAICDVNCCRIMQVTVYRTWGERVWERGAREPDWHHLVNFPTPTKRMVSVFGLPLAQLACLWPSPLPVWSFYLLQWSLLLNFLRRWESWHHYFGAQNLLLALRVCRILTCKADSSKWKHSPLPTVVDLII